AMLGVLNAFVQRLNLEIGREESRPAFSPYYKDEFRAARRKWVLHVWKVEGPSRTWGSQLDAYYRKQPVFAVISGLAPGSWAPIHDFCERALIPCLFPLTVLPKLSEQVERSRTIYLTKGLSTEAEALATWISGIEKKGGAETIVQVYRD